MHVKVGPVVGRERWRRRSNWILEEEVDLIDLLSLIRDLLAGDESLEIREGALVEVREILTTCCEVPPVREF